MALLTAFAAVALLALWVGATFNALVRARNRVEEAWSDVDVQLGRRHDLVPNLVELVQGYAEHESAALELAAKASFQAAGARSRAGRAKAECELSSALSAVFEIAEAYPELAASEPFLRFQRQLGEVEGEIQYARRLYNSNVAAFNSMVESFPTTLVATAGSFRPRSFVDIDETRRRVPAALSAAF